MSTPRVACTIVSNNYLAYARVFTRSFLEQNPDGRVYVLIVDKPDPALRYAEEPFTAVFVESLGIRDFPHYSFRYSILELNTAVKPWLLLHLHRTGGYDRICYFDPDILVTGDLSEIYERLGPADAVLTPHITAPIEDDRVPSERDFLLSGAYNLGFLGIAFNERTLPFLDWWHRRLYRQCLHDVEHGLFVDQRWMDFAPSFLERAEIHRDPGCNVAYWNLMHRSLDRRDGAWWVDGSPLRFFHFSGYMHDRPELISRYQNRFSLSQRPDIEPLFREYGERLRAEGHRELASLPYGFGRFDNGAGIPGLARRTLQLIDPEGKRWPNPFATGPDSFLSWLQQPDDARASIPLPRIALSLWERRSDLQHVFPSPDRKDRQSFAEWFVLHAPENQIGETFIRPLKASLQKLQGQPCDHSTEAMCRRVWDELSHGGPFSGSGLTKEDIDSLTAESGPEPGRRPLIPRFALMLYRQRADLQNSYPDPFGANRVGYALWFVTSGRLEYDLPPAFIRPVLWTLPPRMAVWALLWWRKQMWKRRPQLPREATSLPEPTAIDGLDASWDGSVSPEPSADRGLNVIGWAAAPTGVGEACRNSLLALDAAGIPRALWSLGESASDDFSSGAAGGIGGQGLPYETSLYHVNADMMEIVSRRLPAAGVAGRYRIGYWFWELSHFPLLFAEAFRFVDEVWAPTRFCQDAFKAIAPVEVRWMPPCVAAPAQGPADRQALGVPAESFLFYFAFDALSIPERKNPDGLLRAFARAVRESPRPLHLLLKVNHLDTDAALGRHLLRRTGELPVTLLTQPMSRAEVNALTAACDAYVSLHRSEGLGLPLIEAMYLRRPVIATGYGGVTDFFDESTGWVIRHSMTALEEPRGPYPVGAVWAEPDVEHAAELMVQVATAAPQTLAGRIEAARRRVTELYAPEAAGARLRRELERIERLRHAGRDDQPEMITRAGIAQEVKSPPASRRAR